MARSKWILRLGERPSEVERYLDMIRYACDKMGWDADAFRGYRCRIRYPFYGSKAMQTCEP